MIEGWAVYRCNSPGWPAGSALFTALSLTGMKQQEICRSKLITKTTQVLLEFMVSLFTVVHLKSELSTNFVLLWVVDTPMSVWPLLQARLWVSFTLERSSLAAAYRLKKNQNINTQLKNMLSFQRREQKWRSHSTDGFSKLYWGLFTRWGRTASCAQQHKQEYKNTYCPTSRPLTVWSWSCTADIIKRETWAATDRRRVTSARPPVVHHPRSFIIQRGANLAERQLLIVS